MRVLKEPLFHFILIGVTIFGWFYLVTPPIDTEEQDETIIIDEGDIKLLTARFETTWKRPPTQAELQTLVNALVREEVLVREARKLGLDRGDQVIRARLAQKMDFLTDAIASSVEPEDSVLTAYVQENPAGFTTPRQFAFDQVFLGEAPQKDDVEAALALLNSGADWTGVGAPTLLTRSMPLSADSAINATFGRGFSTSLETLEPGIWSGPIPSGYGQHLVRVAEKRNRIVPPLNDIRDEVLMAWRRDAANELAQAQYETLAAQYQIDLPETLGNAQ